MTAERRQTPLQITRNSLDTNPGPSDWFTGTVYIDIIATPSAPSRLGAASVHFTPGRPRAPTALGERALTHSGARRSSELTIASAAEAA